MAVILDKLNVAEVLLRLGANVDSKTVGKLSTPLHLAFRKGNKKMARLLLRYGGNLLAQDNEGNTPVHYAVRYCNTGSRSDCESSCSSYSRQSLGKSEDFKDIESRPDYLAALDIRNKRGLKPKEMLDIGLQQVVEKLAFAFFDKKSVSKPPNTQRDVNLGTEEVAKVKVKKYSSKNKNQSSKYRLHFTNNPADQVPAYICSATTEMATEDVSEEVSSARCGSVASEDIKDFGKKGLELYEVIKLLGKGSFGEVYLVKYKENSELYAMKVIHKLKIMSQNLVRYAVTEKKVMAQTNHPFIVKLRSAFQTKERLFLIMDYCPGGDLSQCLIREKRFTEDRARIILAEVTLAIEDLHKRNIIFRDLKPDNVVIDKEGHVMLTDFGLSKEGIDGPESAKSFCGSVAYLAPEILKRTGHGKSVDWYLLGVLLHEMLVGQPPFFSHKREELFFNITNGTLKIPSFVSQNAKSLIISVFFIALDKKKLLNRDPARRLGSGPKDSYEIKSHPFFAGINWDDVAQRKLKPPKPQIANIISETKIVLEESPIISTQKRIDGWTFIKN